MSEPGQADRETTIQGAAAKVLRWSFIALGGGWIAPVANPDLCSFLSNQYAYRPRCSRFQQPPTVIGIAGTGCIALWCSVGFGATPASMAPKAIALDSGRARQWHHHDAISLACYGYGPGRRASESARSIRARGDSGYAVVVGHTPAVDSSVRRHPAGFRCTVQPLRTDCQERNGYRATYLVDGDRCNLCVSVTRFHGTSWNPRWHIVSGIGWSIPGTGEVPPLHRNTLTPSHSLKLEYRRIWCHYPSSFNAWFLEGIRTKLLCSLNDWRDRCKE